jgi:archaellum component FlaC
LIGRPLGRHQQRRLSADNIEDEREQVEEDKRELAEAENGSASLYGDRDVKLVVLRSYRY